MPSRDLYLVPSILVASLSVSCRSLEDEPPDEFENDTYLFGGFRESLLTGDTNPFLGMETKHPALIRGGKSFPFRLNFFANGDLLFDEDAAEPGFILLGAQAGFEVTETAALSVGVSVEADTMSDEFGDPEFYIRSDAPSAIISKTRGHIWLAFNNRRAQIDFHLKYPFDLWILDEVHWIYKPTWTWDTSFDDDLWTQRMVVRFVSPSPFGRHGSRFYVGVGFHGLGSSFNETLEKDFRSGFLELGMVF